MDRIIRVTELEDSIRIISEDVTLIGIVLSLREARKVRNEIDAILKVKGERVEDINEEDTEEEYDATG